MITIYDNDNDGNDNSIENIEVKQNFKLTKLLEIKIEHDSENIMCNFSSHILTKNQEPLLIKGLNYAIPPKRLRYENYLINFELLYRDSSKSDVSNEKLFFCGK